MDKLTEILKDQLAKARHSSECMNKVEHKSWPEYEDCTEKARSHFADKVIELERLAQQEEDETNAQRP